MRDFLNKPYSFNDDLKYNLRLCAGISVGMFLFFLFFQPLDLKNEDFNNRLVIIAGFGFITFFILGVNLIFLPLVFPGFFKTGKWNIFRDVIFNAWGWILISTAYTFYGRYVGLIEITYHSMFKLLLLGLAPVVISVVVNQNKILKRYLQSALEIVRKLEPESEEQVGLVTIHSENRSESLELPVDDLIMIKSANNYIEIYWKEGGKVSKTLLRNTLTNIERQLENLPNILRCHRTALVNGTHIRKLLSHKILLDLPDFEESIPVSRNYRLTVKDYLSKRS